MDICDQLSDLDPTPVDYRPDEALVRVVPHTVTVGCAFGSVVELPPIPDSEAVEVCKRISAAMHQCECSEMGMRKRCGQCDG